jgi:citrate synthase
VLASETDEIESVSLPVDVLYVELPRAEAVKEFAVRAAGSRVMNDEVTEVIGCVAADAMPAAAARARIARCLMDFMECFLVSC